jgi:hypothetical protein
VPKDTIEDTLKIIAEQAARSEPVDKYLERMVRLQKQNVLEFLRGREPATSSKTVVELIHELEQELGL